jgi:hypothetical protein
VVEAVDCEAHAMTKIGAWLLGGLASVLAVTALLLGWLNGVDTATAFSSFLASSALSALTFGLVGVVIASKQPGHRIGWLFGLAGVGSGLQALAGQYAQYALVTQAGLLPAGLLAAWANRWIFVIGLALPVSYVLLLFPNGRLPSHRWRSVSWFIAVLATAYAVLLSINPNPVPGALRVANPVGVESLRDALGPALTLGGLLLGACVLGGVASLVVRYRHSRGEPRQQIKCLAYAATVLFVTVAGRPALSSLGVLPLEGCLSHAQPRPLPCRDCRSPPVWRSCAIACTTSTSSSIARLSIRC